jgi:hypothetical protein
MELGPYEASRIPPINIEIRAVAAITRLTTENLPVRCAQDWEGCFEKAAASHSPWPSGPPILDRPGKEFLIYSLDRYNTARHNHREVQLCLAGQTS